MKHVRRTPCRSASINVLSALKCSICFFCVNQDSWSWFSGISINSYKRHASAPRDVPSTNQNNWIGNSVWHFFWSFWHYHFTCTYGLVIICSLIFSRISLQISFLRLSLKACPPCHSRLIIFSHTYSSNCLNCSMFLDWFVILIVGPACICDIFHFFRRMPVCAEWVIILQIMHYGHGLDFQVTMVTNHYCSEPEIPVSTGICFIDEIVLFWATLWFEP
jgi:hypothetical protein